MCDKWFCQDTFATCVLLYLRPSQQYIHHTDSKMYCIMFDHLFTFLNILTKSYKGCIWIYCTEYASAGKCIKIYYIGMTSSLHLACVYTAVLMGELRIYIIMYFRALPYLYVGFLYLYLYYVSVSTSWPGE